LDKYLLKKALILLGVIFLPASAAVADSYGVCTARSGLYQKHTTYISQVFRTYGETPDEAEWEDSLPESDFQYSRCWTFDRKSEANKYRRDEISDWKKDKKWEKPNRQTHILKRRNWSPEFE